MNMQLKTWISWISRSLLPALVFAVATGLVPGAAHAQSAPELRAVPIGGAFDNPVYVAAAPSHPALLFVVERPGRIQVLQDESRLAQAFLDIRNIVLGYPDPEAGSERGLLSVAFPPDYNTSGRFYVFFTNLNGNIEIDEFQRLTADGARADRASRRVVLIVPHRQSANHNGGQLQFGPDGFLYISTGDGAGAPVGEAARSLESLLGKILRIRPLPAGSQSYGIPRSNPFVGGPGRDEIYSYGLRNPWRFAFDGTRIAIGDVGQGRREEVDFLYKTAAIGANFGWPQYEGELVYNNSRPGAHPPKPPILTYDITGDRCAIIGGYVVRDRGLPALEGRYLYGDFCTGEVRSFWPDINAQRAIGDRSTGLFLPTLTSFGVGNGGQIYVSQNTGTVSRLEAAR